MLTERSIKAAQPQNRAYKVYDAKALYIEVTPSGSKLWRIKYRIEGKEKRLSFGAFPEVSLKEARLLRDRARALLEKGIDPAAERAATRKTQANTLEAITREWLDHRAPDVSAGQTSRALSRMERDIFPWLGSFRMEKITPAQILECLQRIASRGAKYSANRTRAELSMIFKYAMATCRASQDTPALVAGAIRTPKTRHMPAITNPKKLGGLLRAIEAYEGDFVTKCALRLLPLVFTRPGELRTAKWENIDLAGKAWSYTASKNDTPHLVPLSRQALAILEELRPLTLGHGFVFPSMRSLGRPMSDNTINAALRRLGYSNDEVTAHGFRATARTLLAEVLEWEPHIIEVQLAHAPPGLGRTYNRAIYARQRAEMMQEWADYLEELKNPVNIRV